MSRARIEPRPTPDGITPLVGYRCWTLSAAPERWTLRSLNGQIAYEVDVDHAVGRRSDSWLVALCRGDADHDAPDENCGCGFYAVKSFRRLRRLLVATIASTRPWRVGFGEITFPVAGRVDMAGKIVEHELGYRAELMRIAELLAVPGTEALVARFAHDLGVPTGEPIADPALPQVVPTGSVALLGDDRLFADAVKAGLEAFGMQVTGIAGTAADGLRLVETEPDVILIDVALPGRSGLAVGRRIVERWPRAKIVAVTASADRPVAEEALSLGFRGYMTKEASVTRFVNCIVAVLDGHLVVPHFVPPAQRPNGDDCVTVLTAREVELLNLLAQGTSVADIARRLYVAPATVRPHIQYVLAKLRLDWIVGDAAVAIRNGLALPPIASRAEACNQTVISRSCDRPFSRTAEAATPEGMADV